MILKTMHTRFVFPFTLARRATQIASDALLNAQVSVPDMSGPGTRACPVWARRTPHPLYGHEMLPHVAGFLFGGETGTRCAYLGTSEDLDARLFKVAEATLHEDRSVILSPPALGGLPFAEVFFLDQGVGLLSLNMTVTAAPPTGSAGVGFGLRTGAALQTNYLLSRIADRKHGDMTTHAVPQATEDVLGDRLRKWPATTGLQRACKPGSSFRLMDLIGELLAPLSENADVRFSGSQEQLTVYCVALAEPTADLGNDIAASPLLDTLYTMAQVEEATHPGPSKAHVPVAWTTLSRVHAVAVSLLGAAHVLIEQPDSDFADDAVGGDPSPTNFNAERPWRAFIKYFSPWLVTEMESLVLQRILRDVHSDAGDADAKAEQLSRLRSYLLELSVHGHFDRVSTRQALHRYLRVCQEGLDLRSIVSDTRAALADFEASWSSRQQIALGTATAEAAARQVDVLEQTRVLTETQTRIERETAANVRATFKMQQNVARLERFIFSFYMAHFLHLCLEGYKPFEHWLAENHVEYLLAVILTGTAILAYLLFPRVIHHSEKQASVA